MKLKDRMDDKEVRMARARGHDRELEVDHDWHREKFIKNTKRIDNLVSIIAELNGRLSEQNVKLALAGIKKN